MNPVIENILHRRSVRRYRPDAIDHDILQSVLNAAQFAPTGMNAQAWRFVVVQDESFRKELAALAAPKYRQWITGAPEFLKDMRREIDAQTDDPVYYGAPVIIFVIGAGMTADMDCPMVCQNIMLAARSFKIGSCWVYFGQMALDNEQVKKTLGLKEGEKVYGPLVLGYPADGFPEPPPKNEPVIKWI